MCATIKKEEVSNDEKRLASLAYETTVHPSRYDELIADWDSHIRRLLLPKGAEPLVIELDEDLRAEVFLKVDSDVELSIDSSAAIRTAGLLGDQFISVELGGEDDVLAAGEEFTFTESALSIDKLIGQFVHNAGVGD